MAIKIHPMVDDGVKKGKPGFAGGTLTCKCTGNPVTVRIASNVASGSEIATARLPPRQTRALE